MCFDMYTKTLQIEIRFIFCNFITTERVIYLNKLSMLAILTLKRLAKKQRSISAGTDSRSLSIVSFSRDCKSETECFWSSRFCLISNKWRWRDKIFYLDKSKASNKGAKTISPVLDGPNESDTSRPLDSEEIQALAIRTDDLEKVRYRKNSRVCTFVFFV